MTTVQFLSAMHTNIVENLRVLYLELGDIIDQIGEYEDRLDVGPRRLSSQERLGLEMCVERAYKVRNLKMESIRALEAMLR